MRPDESDATVCESDTTSYGEHGQDTCRGCARSLPSGIRARGAQLPCPASGSACRDQGRVSADARAPPRRTKCGVSCLSSYRSARRTLIAERATVLARLRATDQHAAIPIDLDGLCTTPR